MSIPPPESLWRGCAAKFSEPLSEEDKQEAKFLVTIVYYINCRIVPRPLSDIVYRVSHANYDIRQKVFRWDCTPFQEVFLNGFQARRQGETRDEIYYNVHHHVHFGGRPLSNTRRYHHVFISTTLSRDWRPYGKKGAVMKVYRYEIYAPGGIFVAVTLRGCYGYPEQHEIAFVNGIAPGYIRSAQLFRITGGGGRPERADDKLKINSAFIYENSNIQRPITHYKDKKGELKPFKTSSYPTRNAQAGKQEMPTDVGAGTDLKSYIDAAFRSSRENEVYLFMKNEYVLVNYAPVTPDDKVVDGPYEIWHGYPSLKDTAFAEYGIDCAFRTHDGIEEAFIFSGNLCARIDCVPHTTNTKIFEGPMPITSMFPFFKGTMFESGADAAFESSIPASYEAYLFKDNQYALINYSTVDCRLVTMALISQGFVSLKDTIFETGIDAAFASHRPHEAYLFKGDSYAVIDLANDRMVDGGIKEILPNWSSLHGILPLNNYGLSDFKDRTSPYMPYASSSSSLA